MLQGILVDLVPANKAFQEKDHEWVNGPATFWADGGDLAIVTRAQIKRWHEEWLERREKGEVTGIGFGIQTKDGIPIGGMGINFMSPYHRAANLGAMIGDPHYWGGGYGTDALLLLIEYCFDWLDLRRLWLNTMSINVRVLRQMEKVGFTQEGLERSVAYANGQWVDMPVFGLLRDEWPGRDAVIERIGLKAK